MKAVRILFLMLPVAYLAGCASREEGFSLPTGNAERGQAAFVEFRCFDCHTVHGVELPAPTDPNQKLVELGGEVSRVKTYEGLVTGIINPSHRLAPGYTPSEGVANGQSPMKVYNDVMTVSQLTDIVTFLQKHYELKVYEPTTYPPYYP